MTVAGSSVIGSAYIAILPDTSKTSTATVAGLSAAGAAGGKALSAGIAKGATEGTTAASGAFSRFSSQTSGAFGGVLSPIAEVKDHFEGLAESVRTHGVMSSQALVGIGTAAVGAGVTLMALGSADKQANAQLQASITATGQSYDDFKGKIEEVIKAQEHNGTAAAATQSALSTLVGITGDTAKATDLMSLAADLAAAKHMSLQGAASAVGRAAEGNTRIFKQYGIQIQTNADGTKNIQGALDQLSKKLDGQASASVSGFTGHLKVLSVQVEDQVASFGQRWGPTITAAGAAMGLLGGAAQLISKGVGFATRATELATEATQADIAVTGQSTVAIGGETAAVREAAVVEAQHASASGRAAVATAEEGVSVGAARGQLELFTLSTQRATIAQTELAGAEEVAGTAGKASFLKMAGGAGIATIAIIGIGLVVNHFMQQSKKQAEENKKAFDEFWGSISANRNQNSLADLTAEAANLTDAIAKQKAQFDASAGSSNEFTRSIDKQIEHNSPYAKQLEELNAKIKTMNQNVDDLSSHFGMNKQAVQDLAAANNLNLAGSYDGLQTAFQKALGGTAEQLTQMQALQGQYGATKAAIDAFASSQKVTLDGTAKSTAAFQAAVDTAHNTGTAWDTMRQDTDKLYSSLSTTTEKLSAFKDLLDQLIGTNISEAQAMDNAQKKINDLGSALDKNSHSLQGSSDAAIGNRAALEGIVQSGIEVANTVYKQTGNLGTANAAYGEYYDKVVNAAKAQGISKESLDGLLGSIGALPNQVQGALSASYSTAVSAGQQVAAGMASGITQNAPSVGVAAEQIPRYLDKAGGQLYIGGVAVGKGLDAGMAAGINADQAVALYQAEMLAVQVIGRVKAKLKMQSPSKVMMDLGSNVSQGFALGIALGAPGVATAAQGIGLAATAVSLGGISIPGGAPVHIQGIGTVPASDAALAGLGGTSTSAPVSTLSGIGGTSTADSQALAAILTEMQAANVSLTKIANGIDLTVKGVTAVDHTGQQEVAALNKVGAALAAYAGAETKALASLSAGLAQGKHK